VLSARPRVPQGKAPQTGSRQVMVWSQETQQGSSKPPCSPRCCTCPPRRFTNRRKRRVTRARKAPGDLTTSSSPADAAAQPRDEQQQPPAAVSPQRSTHRTVTVGSPRPRVSQRRLHRSPCRHPRPRPTAPRAGKKPHLQRPAQTRPRDVERRSPSKGALQGRKRCVPREQPPGTQSVQYKMKKKAKQFQDLRREVAQLAAPGCFFAAT